MNTLPNVYKLCHFNLTMSPLYLVKLKVTLNSRLLTAVRYVEPTVPDLRRKSFNVRLFPYLLENSFNHLLKKYFTFLWVLSKIYLQTQYG